MYVCLTVNLVACMIRPNKDAEEESHDGFFEAYRFNNSSSSIPSSSTKRSRPALLDNAADIVFDFYDTAGDSNHL